MRVSGSNVPRSKKYAAAENMMSAISRKKHSRISACEPFFRALATFCRAVRGRRKGKITGECEEGLCRGATRRTKRRLHTSTTAFA